MWSAFGFHPDLNPGHRHHKQKKPNVCVSIIFLCLLYSHNQNAILGKNQWKPTCESPFSHCGKWNAGQHIWSLVFLLFFDWLHSSSLRRHKTILKKQDKMTNCAELHVGIWSLQQMWQLKEAVRQKLKSCPTFKLAFISHNIKTTHLITIQRSDGMIWNKPDPDTPRGPCWGC